MDWQVQRRILQLLKWKNSPERIQRLILEEFDQTVTIAEITKMANERKTPKQLEIAERVQSIQNRLREEGRQGRLF